jgi:tRNA pseudouridine55 synthase
VAKKQKGQPIHGWLNLNKPLHLSSNDALNAVKRVFNPAKVGHGGTLDPLASGVLPVAFGEATKTVSYAMDGAKTYVAKVMFGTATSTDDLEGEVVEDSKVRPAEILIQKALHDMGGQMIQQRPPAYSALKVDGKRAYDLARKGQDVILESRPVWLGAARLLAFDGNEAEIELEVGKGFYVRSFARDLGKALRTCAHLSGLCRTRVGPFSIDDAISLDSLQALDHRAALSALLPLERVLDDIPALDLGQAEALRLKNGQTATLLRKSFLDQMAKLEDGQTVRARYDNRLIALAEFRKATLKTIRGFN